MHTARSAPRLYVAVTALLMTALLLAQWAGLAHRVNHAPLASLHANAQERSAPEDGAHSCVAFDAAAVADAISLPPCATLPLAGAKILALWAAFASWDAPTTLPFSSRAPPVS